MADSSGDDDESALFDEYANIPLWIASKYGNRTALAADWDDVHADAMVGVLDAIRHFDPARGTTRRAYVFTRAGGAAIDGIRQRSYTPRSARGKQQEPLSLDLILDAVVNDEAPWEPSATERGYAEVDAAE